MGRLGVGGPDRGERPGVLRGVRLQRFVALTETLHCRHDARLSEGESEAVHMRYGRAGRAPGLRRHGSPLGPALCLNGLDGPRPDTPAAAR